MHDVDYAYAVANIRANELKLLTKSDLTALISSKSVTEAMRLLKNKGYGGSESFDTEDQMLKVQREKVFSYVKELAGGSRIFDIFLMKNDFQNLKVLIKSKITGNDSGLNLSPGLMSVPELKAAVDSETFSALPEWVNEAAKNAFLTTAETGNGQLCDIIIDKALLKQMQKAAQDSKNTFLTELFGKIIALYNVKTALRACKSKKSCTFIFDALVPCDYVDINELADCSKDMESLLDYIKNTVFSESVDAVAKGLSTFEKYCDDFIIKHIKTVKYNAFGIEPLIAYLICNEMEQKNVQIILAGKRGGIPAEDISERMRETYV